MRAQLGTGEIALSLAPVHCSKRVRRASPLLCLVPNTFCSFHWVFHTLTPPPPPLCRRASHPTPQQRELLDLVKCPARVSSMLKACPQLAPLLNPASWFKTFMKIPTDDSGQVRLIAIRNPRCAGP